MADEELVQQVIEGVRRLDIESKDRDGVEATDLADYLRLPVERHTDLWHAIKVAEERGKVEVFNWSGGMGMPEGLKWGVGSKPST
jgi:hypothetical protein